MCPDVIQLIVILCYVALVLYMLHLIQRGEQVEL